MKKRVFNYLIISLSLFLFNACDIIPDIEEIDTVTDELTNTINIPDGFDFSTHHEVQITINDDDNYARYDVYIYSDEQYFAGTETFENQSGEIVSEPVYRNDVMNKLVFTGVPKNGELTQNINLPKYYSRLIPLSRNSIDSSLTVL